LWFSIVGSHGDKDAAVSLDTFPGDESQKECFRNVFMPQIARILIRGLRGLAMGWHWEHCSAEPPRFMDVGKDNLAQA